MTLRPLGDRVLIRPDAAPTQTQSGLHLVEHWPDEVSGTVIAVGTPRHQRADEAEGIARRLDSALFGAGSAATKACGEAAHLLRVLTQRDPLVSVGDRVLFSRIAGQDVQIDDTRYVLMREADLLAVLDADERTIHE